MTAAMLNTKLPRISTCRARPDRAKKCSVSSPWLGDNTGAISTPSMRQIAGPTARQAVSREVMRDPEAGRNREQRMCVFHLA